MFSLENARLPSLVRHFIVLHVVALMLTGCGGSGGGGGSGSKANVTLFASKAKITGVSGAAAVTPTAFFETAGGAVLITDGASGSILALLSDGTVFVLTPKSELTTATGASSVSLGAFDQVRAGVLQGRLLVADAVSGNLLTILANGSPGVFSTLAKVAVVTGKASANMSLPRELTTNQIVAQDLESVDMVKYDTAGNVTAFVSAAQIAAAAGVPAAQAIIDQWVRGAATGNLYGRLDATNNIIRLQINGTVSQYVSGATLKTLFKDVADLHVLDVVADPSTDALLLLIGDGSKGVAVAFVSASGGASVYSSKADLAKAASDGVDISDISVLLNGIPVAVDRGGAQVLTFGLRNGKVTPLIVGRGQDIRDAAGTTTPLLSIAASITVNTAVVFDEASNSLIRVE